MGVAALPLVATLVATGAQVYNTNRAARKQDEALAAGIRSQAATQRKATARVDEAIADIAKSSPGKAQATALGQYQQATRGTEQQARAGQALEGLSEAYDAATRAGQASSSERIGNVADLLSRIDAPALQRQREGFGQADLASSLGVLGGESQGQDFLARLKAGAVRRSPWIDAFSAGLSAAAKNYSAQAGGGTGAGVSGTPQTIGDGGMYRGYT